MNQQNNQVATVQPSRLPLPPSIAKEHNLQPAQWRVLVDQTFPSAQSAEAILMALSYCRARNLDIFKKPVHIVPMWSSVKKSMVETVWPGIAEIRTTAARTGEYAGIDEVEFGRMIDGTFVGTVEEWEQDPQTGRRQKVAKEITKTVRYPEWASVVVYRFVKGQKVAFHTKIYWEETYATVGKTSIPNDMWTKRPRGQLAKCVEADALRKAFPEEVGSMYAAEEMEGRVIDGETAVHDVAPKAPPTPPKPPVPPSDPVDTQEAQDEITDVQAEDVTPDNEAADEPTTDGEELDDTAIFDALEERMSNAADAAEIEEIWTDVDPLAVFEGKPNGEINQGIAIQIKKRHLKRVGGNG